MTERSSASPLRVRRVTPSYFECGRRLEVLRRFQDLVRQNERWAHEIDFARPLADLLPEGTTERRSGKSLTNRSVACSLSWDSFSIWRV